MRFFLSTADEFDAFWRAYREDIPGKAFYHEPPADAEIEEEVEADRWMLSLHLELHTQPTFWSALNMRVNHMGTRVIVCDIETVPDLTGFARANGHDGKADDDIRVAMGDKFPKHIYHSSPSPSCGARRWWRAWCPARRYASPEIFSGTSGADSLLAVDLDPPPEPKSQPDAA